MALSIGGNSISKAYLGSTEIQKMYLGSSLVYDGTPSALTPIMTNFRVEEANPNQVLFDTPLGAVTGINADDFTISGTNILSVSDNHFTLSSDLNFYSNNTIRKEAGNSYGCHDFDLEYIDNRMDEPGASNTDRFVTTSGGTGAGTEGDPWSITHAALTATAGTTVWVKAGNYGDKELEFLNIGTPTDPIKFIGYKTDWTNGGDINSMYWNQGDALDANEMPLIDGVYGGDGTGWKLKGDYSIFRNLQGTNYMDIIKVTGGPSNIFIDNCLAKDAGKTDGGAGDSGTAILMNSETTANCRIKNSKAVNGSVANIRFYGNHAAILGCEAITDRDSNGSGEATDYYIEAHGSNHIFKDTNVEMVGALVHTGHGIALKAATFATEYCLIQSCTIKGIKGSIEFRHSQSKNHVARDVTITDGLGVTGGIHFRDGTSFNRVYNSKIIGLDEGVRFYETQEDVNGQPAGVDNKVINTIFDDCTIAINTAKESSTSTTPQTLKRNEFLNCTFTNCGTFFNISQYQLLDNTNLFTNNIINNVSSYNSGVAETSVWDYNNFFGSFTALGTNTTAFNPLLDANYKPQWDDFEDAKVPTLGNYDYYDSQRATTDTTPGSVVGVGEVIVDTPFAIISYEIADETSTTAWVRCYMTEQCSINYYVDTVKNAASSDVFNAGEIGPYEFRHTRTLTGLTPGITADLIIEITAQDDGEIVQSENIPLTTLP